MPILGHLCENTPRGNVCDFFLTKKRRYYIVKSILKIFVVDIVHYFERKIKKNVNIIVVTFFVRFCFSFTL